MKKKTMIFITLFFVLIVGIIYSTNKPYTGGVLEQQKILSKRGNHVIILSQKIIGNNVISEIIDQKAAYGYANFKVDEKGRSHLKDKNISTELIVIDRIKVNDTFYEVLMCYKSGLDYAEVTYTDDSTNKKDNPLRVEMNNKTVAIFEVPEHSSYISKVVFYNYNGNKFEWYQTSN